jgi:hypothetical protein
MVTMLILFALAAFAAYWASMKFIFKSGGVI